MTACKNISPAAFDLILKLAEANAAEIQNRRPQAQHALIGENGLDSDAEALGGNANSRVPDVVRAIIEDIQSQSLEPLSRKHFLEEGAKRVCKVLGYASIVALTVTEIWFKTHPDDSNSEFITQICFIALSFLSVYGHNTFASWAQDQVDAQAGVQTVAATVSATHPGASAQSRANLMGLKKLEKPQEESQREALVKRSWREWCGDACGRFLPGRRSSKKDDNEGVTRGLDDASLAKTPSDALPVVDALAQDLAAQNI